MGASREGNNIFNKFGRQVCWRYFRQFEIPPCFWKDSFKWMVCAMIGHRQMYVPDPSKSKVACRFCGQYVVIKYMDMYGKLVESRQSNPQSKGETGKGEGIE